DDFRTANYFWILIVLFAFTISNVSRAIRWNMLIRPLGYRPRFINSFLTTVLGYFANLGLPRLGEVVRGGTLARYEKIPMEKVMGTIVVDRVVDVISILVMTSLAFLLEFNTLWEFAQQYVPVDRLIKVIAILVGLGVVGLAGLWLMRKTLAKTAFYEKFMKILTGFYDGLKTIGQLEKPWLFVLHSINIWVMYYLMTYLCFFAFAPTAGLSPLAGLVVFVFGGWGIVIPSPGGMGTYHFLVQIALGIYGISGDDAFSFANIAFFSIQLGCNVTIGLLALILLPIINRSYEPKNVEA
ncbi:MAG: flippase-like domain-containing protein, partial [Saprospiraceae bacterium]|nr:flippase-like domain-containing protein [Saprospiraceae bacterium]